MKNNKKGFTLIELLAVIVILAIIALIATPIVLNIINDAKEESELRSGEFYLKSLELSIAQAILDGQNIQDKEYNIMSNGNICLEKYSNVGDTIECKNDDVNDADNSKSNELIVEVKGKVPTSGTIAITNGQVGDISLKLNDKEIVKDEKGELKYKTEETVSKEKTLDEVCELKEDVTPTGKSAGDKYECKVDPNKEPYTFYVLTTPTAGDTTINLIMDQNINSAGTPAGMTGVTKNGDNVYNLVAWISTEEYYEDSGGVIPDELLNDGGACQYGNECVFNNKGPITAMNFLSEATKNWTNTNEMKISTIAYEDGSTYTMSKTYYTNARMPIYSSDATKTEVANKTDANAYLYDNLDPEGMNAPHGYWTLSPVADASHSAWYVDYSRVIGGSVGYGAVDYADNYGVRPVINLKI